MPVSLLPQHVALLDASGIDPTVRQQRGYRSATEAAELRELGFSNSQQVLVPALVLPVWGVNGQVVSHQIRPDHPRTCHGRLPKYELAKDSHTAIDVPPRIRPMLGNPTLPLLISDGIRQADAGASHGLCSIAVLGHWSWRGLE